MAKATPLRSGDELAGVAAGSAEERVAAQIALRTFRSALPDEPLIPYEEDAVTRLIMDTHDREAFCRVAEQTVGGFRDRLLPYETGRERSRRSRPGSHPEWPRPSRSSWATRT